MKIKPILVLDEKDLRGMIAIVKSASMQTVDDEKGGMTKSFVDGIEDHANRLASKAFQMGIEYKNQLDQ